MVLEPATEVVVYDGFLPWDCQPGEGQEQYAAFIAFRDLEGKRSWSKGAHATGRTHLTIRTWAEQFHWLDRCRAWDSHLQEERDEFNKRRRKAFVANHGVAAGRLLAMAERAITPPEVLPKGIKKPEDWRPTAAMLTASALAMDKAIHHQRLSEGMPTDYTRQDMVVRDQLAEATEVNRELFAILERVLCDACREVVIAELEILARRHQAVEAAAGEFTAP